MLFFDIYLRAHRELIVFEMDFDSMYQRLNRSSPSLSALSKSIPFQAPIDHPFETATALHQRSASATLGSPNEIMEDIDTSTRPRLTHEQVTQLEEEFSKLPKPNTDFKKNLADRIGLTLARVNVSGMTYLLPLSRTDLFNRIGIRIVVLSPRTA